MKTLRKRQSGVTLVEILLVTVVVSAMIYMSIGYMQQKVRQARYDKAVAQIQQILNAASAYYVANGKWPASASNLNCLQGTGGGCTVAYLSQNVQNNFTYPPSTYAIGSQASQFQVIVEIGSGSNNVYSDASTLAGMLPNAFATSTKPPAACTQGSTECFVYANIPIPGQNSNNATAVNFAALYHNGACVPVPSCPQTGSGQMAASILVSPGSVTGAAMAPTTSGGNCNATDQSGCNVNAYPINSFSAFATTSAVATSSSGPPSCQSFLAGSPTAAPCEASVDSAGNATPITSGEEYWRVCISVTTEAGQAVPDTNPWGQLVGTVMAITRCSVHGENSGSGFTVWSQ